MGMTDYATYPSGLRLAGRRVVVVGGGHVAQRRVPALLAVGAEVTVVSPVVTPSIEGLADEITLVLRGYRTGDLAGAWYVIAATDDREVNEQISAEAESQRTFCVRADDATRATAWTPAVGRHDIVTVAVLDNFVGGRDPRRSAYVRDEILTALRDGEIAAPRHRDRTAGVVLIGGGPGDPELVTVAGRKALMEADVVVADRLAPRELLGELSPDVELIDVAKLPRGRFTAQDEINRVIVERALAGKRVARFKGGDSFVFGRGYEEVEACQAAGVPVTVVPGISSPLAVPAVAGIPVTHRGVAHEFTVVSGHLAGRLGRSRPAAGHGGADDGGGERARDRRCDGVRRPSREHAGRHRLRRHDAGRAHRADHARHDRRRHRHARRTPAGDRGRRRRGGGRPSRALHVVGIVAACE
jgi:uroporphyrin-III C-methyltransferase/precorrin-2 dehydrogenase/sirohydrochlorin ferrochelatase